MEDAQSQINKKKRKVCVFLEAANKPRHEEELDSTELSYKRQILETHRCCIKGTSNPGYADHPLAHPSSPAPYPQRPPQYWRQNFSYTLPPPNYYSSFLPPNYSPIPVCSESTSYVNIVSYSCNCFQYNDVALNSTDSDPSEIFDEYIDLYAQKSKADALEIRLAGSALRKKRYLLEGRKSNSETGWQSLDIEAGIEQRLLNNVRMFLNYHKWSID
ncbi:hypothetical protein V1517DRAFT_375880 [Lipomyces orientalis]|uniref:Uncharacterized protein n=1 Tax=Lipomyces orientalis TaxID=1233043 RepID=A0ACC3TGP1_9ASCO